MEAFKIEGVAMIKSFADKKTERLFHDRDDEEYRPPTAWISFLEVAVRKLDMVHAATELRDLRSPPGNRLEKLHRDREGQWSIRIDQYRVCFSWKNDAAEDVEIVDYHD